MISGEISPFEGLEVAVFFGRPGFLAFIGDGRVARDGSPLYCSGGSGGEDPAPMKLLSSEAVSARQSDRSTKNSHR